MVQIRDICEFLDRLAPLQLAEDWDNVGLLAGNPQREVKKLITCLTLTADVAAEAVAGGAQLVVSHHPILFRPVQRLTADTVDGAMLLTLLEGGVAVYSPHTAYDSARDGINQQLAEALGLSDTGVLRPLAVEAAADDAPATAAESSGAGRHGLLKQPLSLAAFSALVKQRLDVGRLQYVGDPGQTIRRVAIACGSAAEFIHDARRAGCDVLLTGEARFHDAVLARALRIPLVLAGHYATERPAVEQLARVLAEAFPGITAWPSRQERDPLCWE